MHDVNLVSVEIGSPCIGARHGGNCITTGASASVEKMSGTGLDMDAIMRKAIRTFNSKSMVTMLVTCNMLKRK